ncbi:MAG: zinc-ribbon domain-containing protein [Clostridia bacterium]|nr:zinc-ribbon domain-containing protein [Clostridia bacterium]
MPNTVSEMLPDLVAEWSDKNLPLTPDQLTYGSNRKVWWKGKCGHEWLASPHSRSSGAGCPYCSSNRILPGFNDLASQSPILAAEWSERNRTLKPESIGAHSPRNVWWKCRHGHEWKARVADRADGSQCPYCVGQRVWPGFNDLTTLFPKLASEWSGKNAKSPSSVSPKSTENVWWKCPDCGLEYKAVISSRVKGLICPACSEYHTIPGNNDLLTTDPKLCKEWNYEKNEKLARPMRPTEHTRNSMYIVWWRGSCGHEWKARICDRAIEHQGCLICESEFNEAFPYFAFMYYLKALGLKGQFDGDEPTGLPISVYVPEIHLAVDFFGERTGEGKKRKYIKGKICSQHGITYVCLEREKNKSNRRFLDKIVSAFRERHVYFSPDPEKDIQRIRSIYEKWKKQ